MALFTHRLLASNHPRFGQGISCPVAIGAPGSYALQIAEAKWWCPFWMFGLNYSNFTAILA